ncbi:geranylgeranyl pyrophosphate synthase [Streptomyces capoamus]|uniref:Geranylgeranyl pyrophosphate synthase n=1 Tax=Streptomyces capoamus TaxID=68183 RepID=A0A919F2Z4_9ACTN|nr:polyprenyl synthetase family protein [Streptomyces capoamus]GGW13185.1 geranylgeranyl pyrophosphate synthase [Streptomyces libani subsp. rufus]GHG74545.1 geranylgeranyl pyrophosphate synthase [Streptomyces capoamus]
MSAVSPRLGSKAMLQKLRDGRGPHWGPADRSTEERLGAGLEAVESELQHTVSYLGDPRIAELTGHIAAAGGKRLRPLLVLLAAEFGQSQRRAVTGVAVIMELIHIASLYHDDVMDAAATRRGVISANTRWGNRQAVRGGDWLLARAAQRAADIGAEAVYHHSRAAVRLVEGQMRELVGPASGEDPVEYYFEVIVGKTAELLATSLSLGAFYANASAGYDAALRAYGMGLGAAFQIADDLMDLLSPAEATGKEQGTDLRAGVLSLPVLLARADCSAQGAELRALVGTGPVTDRWAHRRALELFPRSPAVDQTRTIMRAHVSRARAALASLPQIPARTALNVLCDIVLDQTCEGTQPHTGRQGPGAP